MPTPLEELVEFLHHPQAPIRTVALENVVGLSQGPESSIFQYNNYEPIKDLKILARDKGKTIVQHSLTILANLCEDEKIRDLIVDDFEFVKYLIEKIILDLENRNSDIGCILLTNIAKNDKIIKIFEIRDLDLPNKEVFKSSNAIDCLLDIFVKGSEKSLNKLANYDYLSFFFADISRFLQGRKYFVTKQSYDDILPITKILVFTEYYESKIRREGVASTIKNSLFEIDSHLDLLDESQANILPYLLLPIASSKDAELDEDELFELPDELQLLSPDKTRDPVPEIIIVHLESLLLLCSSKETRNYLRTKSVYPLIRELHKNIDNDDLADVVERLVNMLMRDEAPEGSEDKIEEIDEKMEEPDYESDGDEEIVEVL
ncbi:hypothetical protein BN7_746 [Wickerhamomyces ciferrii]|uniref:Protein HGH1 homolog n=1 Tax=Wickerhamomyces ciferrii (strain ATCC 14091 / BCRC 22168 / CBS 111 / JCM 3599 / NBRC 0793 / NRRL Y-1031 F-60-10) TaxID=1206466 RepID=K0KIJ1_WICCF|nr:uncharacterized protein BN7_746 [Wickerhamomyces ciferrii]CCH41209.1 hypothetical protein BN7_746 [Wickerhamomyces ciferrii]